MVGGTTRSVSGAAFRRIASSSTLAPRVLKMRLTLAVCRANPNWIPIKPKHMFHICQNDSVGLLFIAPSQEYCALRCCIRVGRGACPLLDVVRDGRLRRRDRKSVVSGKSVSVSVDLGGRRIIKNQNST